MRSAAAALMFCLACITHAQACPKQSSKGPDDASASRTLYGMLVYHDGIRQWFELKLAAPVCDQTSVQVIAENDKKELTLERMRDCHVETAGVLYPSPTGYYSLDVAQSLTHVRGVGACRPKRPLPRITGRKPAKWVRRYNVIMQVNYRDGDHPVRLSITRGRQRLGPWQAYASYMFTGGFVLYGKCGTGFEVTRAFGTPEADPSVMDYATYDPETAAEKGKRDLRLVYTCKRGASPND